MIVIEIAKKHNCHRSAIYKRLKENDIIKPINLPIEQIINEYTNGMTIVEVAKKHNCNPNTISRRLKENNINVTKIINLPIEQIIDEYINGMNIVELSKKYNCNSSTISRKLKKYNINVTNIIELPINEIIDEYQNGMSTIELAKKYKCGITTINERLHDNNVKFRSISEIKKELYKKVIHPACIELPDEEICKKYQDGMSTIELAEEYECSIPTITKRLHDNKIKIRSQIINLPDNEISKKYLNGSNSYQLAEEYGCSRATIVKRLRDNGTKIRSNSESQMGLQKGKDHPNYIELPDKEICEKYLNGANIVELAEEYECAINTINRRLHVNGIDVAKERCKHISVTSQGITYDEWEDFATTKSYCLDWNKEIRESTREKYGRMCFLTGLSESENIGKDGKQRKLSVHHYDMDKGQGCNGKTWKLVPLCMEWHGKVHNELWEARIIWLLDNVWN